MSPNYLPLTPEQLDRVRAATADGEAAMRGISPETVRNLSGHLDRTYETAADVVAYVETLRMELIAAHQIGEDEPLTPEEIIQRHIRYSEEFVDGPARRAIRRYGR